MLTKGIKKWLTDYYGRDTAKAFSKRFIAWDTPEFPDKPRPGAPVAPTGLAHLEGRDAGEGDIDDQHTRPALGGPHVAHLQGHCTFLPLLSPLFAQLTEEPHHTLLGWESQEHSFGPHLISHHIQ